MTIVGTTSKQLRKVPTTQPEDWQISMEYFTALHNHHCIRLKHQQTSLTMKAKENKSGHKDDVGMNLRVGYDATRQAAQVSRYVSMTVKPMEEAFSREKASASQQQSRLVYYWNRYWLMYCKGRLCLNLFWCHNNWRRGMMKICKRRFEVYGGEQGVGTCSRAAKTWKLLICKRAWTLYDQEADVAALEPIRHPSFMNYLHGLHVDTNIDLTQNQYFLVHIFLKRRWSSALHFE